MALLKSILEKLKIDLSLLENHLQKYPEETYAGLNLLPEALYTSEEDSENILNALHLKDGDRVLDIGCGIGSFLLTGARLFPQVKFIGIEMVQERLNIAQLCAQELNLTNVHFLSHDINDIDLPRADYYFFYLGTGKTYSKLMRTLLKESQARDFKIIAIESHGDLLPDLHTRQWLEETQNIPLFTDRHSPNAVIFRTLKNNYESMFMREIYLMERDLKLHGEITWNTQDRHLWEYAFTKKEWKFVSSHRDPKIEFLSCNLCNFSTFTTIKSPETSGDIPLDRIKKVSIQQI